MREKGGQSTGKNHWRFSGSHSRVPTGWRTSVGSEQSLGTGEIPNGSPDMASGTILGSRGVRQSREGREGEAAEGATLMLP